jgi:hypothetical protein
MSPASGLLVRCAATAGGIQVPLAKGYNIGFIFGLVPRKFTGTKTSFGLLSLCLAGI